jgi:hypothetical protein
VSLSLTAQQLSKHASFIQIWHFLLELWILQAPLQNAPFSPRTNEGRFQANQFCIKISGFRYFLRLNSFPSVQVWFRSDVSFLSYDIWMADCFTLSSLLIQMKVAFNQYSLTVRTWGINIPYVSPAFQTCKFYWNLTFASWVTRVLLLHSVFSPRPNEGRFQPIQFRSKNSGRRYYMRRNAF